MKINRSLVLEHDFDLGASSEALSALCAYIEKTPHAPESLLFTNYKLASIFCNYIPEPKYIDTLIQSLVRNPPKILVAHYQYIVEDLDYSETVDEDLLAEVIGGRYKSCLATGKPVDNFLDHVFVTYSLAPEVLHGS
ncbi:hypothetical protein [Chromohalobacter canadensis]|uniref:hypothetical protein n=1 Tax=Chromohalobacter canadensis TaxID=141389 RepID=UPI00240FB6FF|nr:hypothetical protein [Chromohalobacter canadensis]